MARVADSLKRAVTSGRLSETDHDVTWQRLAFGHELEALESCDLVIEAVAEDEAMKIDVFRRLDSCANRTPCWRRTHPASRS